MSWLQDDWQDQYDLGGAITMKMCSVKMLYDSRLGVGSEIGVLLCKHKAQSSDWGIGSVDKSPSGANTCQYPRECRQGVIASYNPNPL